MWLRGCGDGSLIQETWFKLSRAPFRAILDSPMACTTRTPSAPGRNHQSLIATGMAVVWAIALANLLFHIYFNNNYGYFRDEFDYMSCGDHLAWGFVDQPPLIPFLIHLCRAVFGDSLRSIRFIPAVASSLLIVQTATIARELGGRRYALLLGAICALIAPPLPFQRQPTRHELSGAQSLDGLRILRHPRH
jgi:hypothetical protein